MIKVESKFKDFGIQIPTDISEITSEALDAILTNVVVAKHYCVVALCQNESLFGVINNKVSTVEVMPIIAKISKEDAELIGMNQMDKIIIDRSTLERGYHLYLKHNVLSPQFVNKYITNDTELTRSITVCTFGQNQGYKKGFSKGQNDVIKNQIITNNNHDKGFYFSDYKGQINDLRAAITDKHKAINPFVYHSAEKAN